MADRVRYGILVTPFGIVPARLVHAPTKERKPPPVLASVHEQSVLQEEGSSGWKTCVICLDETNSPQDCTLFPGCAHVYHKPCLQAWLEHKPICPQCSSPFDPQQESSPNPLETAFRRSSPVPVNEEVQLFRLWYRDNVQPAPGVEEFRNMCRAAFSSSRQQQQRSVATATAQQQPQFTLADVQKVMEEGHTTSHFATAMLHFCEGSVSRALSHLSGEHNPSHLVPLLRNMTGRSEEEVERALQTACGCLWLAHAILQQQQSQASRENS